jgi:hypothetical protein
MRRDIALQMARRLSDQDIILDYRMTVRVQLPAGSTPGKA